MIIKILFMSLLRSLVNWSINHQNIIHAFILKRSHVFFIKKSLMCSSRFECTFVWRFVRVCLSDFWTDAHLQSPLELNMKTEWCEGKKMEMRRVIVWIRACFCLGERVLPWLHTTVPHHSHSRSALMFRGHFMLRRWVVFFFEEEEMSVGASGFWYVLFTAYQWSRLFNCQSNYLTWCLMRKSPINIKQVVRSTTTSSSWV